MNIVPISRAEYKGLSSSQPGQQSLTFAAQRVRSSAASCFKAAVRITSSSHQLLPAQSVCTRSNLARRQETTLDLRAMRDSAALQPAQHHMGAMLTANACIFIPAPVCTAKFPCFVPMHLHSSLCTHACSTC